METNAHTVKLTAMDTLRLFHQATKGDIEGKPQAPFSAMYFQATLKRILDKDKLEALPQNILDTLQSEGYLEHRRGVYYYTNAFISDCSET